MKNKRLKLLILENNKDDIKAVKNIITNSKLPFLIKVAGSKQYFNEHLNNFHPDLIISNYKLPGFTGLEALSILKKTGYIIPFIFFTDPANETIAAKCLKAGASDYILKKQSSKLIPAVLSSLKNKSFMVSEIKKAGDKLHNSEERIKLLFDNLLLGVFRMDVKGRIILANTYFVKMLGYDSYDEISGACINITNKNERENIFNQLKRKNFLGEYEAVWTLKDGNKINVKISASPAKDDFGKIIFIEGIVEDISGRKKFENALIESEELYKGVVQSLTEGLIITDVSDKVLFANMRMSKITGFEIEEMVGQYNYSLFYEPVQWKIILEKNKNRFSGISDRFEIKMRKKNGDEFWALINGSPYKNSKGKINGSINTITDISKDKLAAKALKESEEKYRTVVQNVREVIFKTDYTGTITFLNPYWAEITGHGLGKSIGRYLFDFIHPDDKQRTIKEFISIIYKRKDYCRFEFRVETSTGEYRWFLINARITIDEMSNIIGTYGTLNDIHDRRLTEEELIKAKDKAEESDKLKSHFLTQISHEIRSPLNIILGYNSLIKERLEKEPSLNLNTEFNIIEANGRRLLRTIDLILNMSIIQTGNYDVSKEEFDLNNLIENMLLEFKSIAEIKKIKLSYNNSCRTNNIVADKFTLTRAFQNLLDNAVKFTDKGGVEVFSYENDESIVIDITDTGVGISQEYLSRLFEPFSQEEEGYSRKFDGNGLGLALTKKYIELNQGEITVKSAKGIGTTFTIKLDWNKKPGGE